MAQTSPDGRHSGPARFEQSAGADRLAAGPPRLGPQGQALGDGVSSAEIGARAVATGPNVVLHLDHGLAGRRPPVVRVTLLELGALFVDGEVEPALELAE